ncbi:hypothetical protein ACIQ7Q_27610 [Streptomyces sp. NPDC096176]|uniref:hypothetical protein n=1 Tax=Streptomyces sp. NPDC096176 TaxID=3366079 RepID=UPI00380E158C
MSVLLEGRHPDGKHIRIAVSPIRASGPPEERRGIRMVNPGGPAPALTWAARHVARFGLGGGAGQVRDA